MLLPRRPLRSSTAAVAPNASAPGCASPPPPIASSPSIPPTAPAPQASDFLPIARDDLLRQGEEVRRATGWMWFGRRDIVPPTSDPRTLLIDRGMLTQGLITAEELAAMHQTGDEWAQYANRLEQIQVMAGQSADAAVEADRAARAEVKARKKAEAAERKRLRAEAVTHRKATDISFVGRGVSALLNDRVSDVEKLTAAGLPVLRSAADLAATLGLSVSRLRWLCYHTEAATRIHYVQFEVPKEERRHADSLRSAPDACLGPAMDSGTLAGQAACGRSRPRIRSRPLDTDERPAALRLRHRGESRPGSVLPFNRLRARPASLPPSRLFRLRRHSAGAPVYRMPRRRVVYDGTPYFVATGQRGLPQGACTSPSLCNQIARRLDRRLGGIANKLGWAYTRYADDLTFSAGPGSGDKVAYLLARIRHIVQDERFAVNTKKTRVQRKETRQVVTGLVVNAVPAVPRDTVRRLRAILHRAKSAGLASQNRDNHPNFRGWVEGMIAYVSMVKPALGEKFRVVLASVPGK